MIPTFTKWSALKPITEQFPERENEEFRTIAYTIGAMMVFPGNQIDRKQTINVARGFNRTISDRFDLTLECIRRQYADKESPLTPTLSLYADFFALFCDFRGYVSFFLLDDLVTNASSLSEVHFVFYVERGAPLRFFRNARLSAPPSCLETWAIA